MNKIISVSKMSVTLLAALSISGCTAIHSSAVNGLIAKEGDKLTQVSQGTTNLINATKQRMDAMNKSVSDLNAAMKQQQTSELVHSLIFSANQNISTKQGVDAHAVAFMIGELYLAEQSGLQKDVNDQFAQDITALQQQAVKIQQSWNSLKTLNDQILAFSKKSSFASVDADLIAAVANEIPGASADIEAVLRNSQRVNDSLNAALGIVPLKGQAIDQTQTQLSGLIDLLDRVKAAPKTDGH